MPRRSAFDYALLRVVPRVPALQIVAEAAMARGRPPEQAHAQAETLLLRLNIPHRLHGLPQLLHRFRGRVFVSSAAVSLDRRADDADVA